MLSQCLLQTATLFPLGNSTSEISAPAWLMGKPEIGHVLLVAFITLGWEDLRDGETFMVRKRRIMTRTRVMLFRIISILAIFFLFFLIVCRIKKIKFFYWFNIFNNKILYFIFFCLCSLYAPIGVCHGKTIRFWFV